MISSVHPAFSEAELPARADVVVVGGGIIGVSAAFHLAKKGISVTLCEKGRIAGEQSSRNWGWCRTMGRDPAEIPLSIESLRMWAGMNQEIGTETGFRRTGIIYLCEGQRELDERAAWLAHARQYQINSRLLSSTEVDQILPGSARRWQGALITPSDGRAEPQLAVPVPKQVPGVEPHILDPIRTWRSKGEFAETAGRLVQMFRDNFKKFEDHTDGRVRSAGPTPRIALARGK